MDWTTTESTRQLARMFDKKHPDAMQLAVDYIKSHLVKRVNLEKHIASKDIATFTNDEYQNLIDMFRNKYLFDIRSSGFEYIEDVLFDHINRRLIPINPDTVSRQEVYSGHDSNSFINENNISYSNKVLTFNNKYYFWKYRYKQHNLDYATYLKLQRLMLIHRIGYQDVDSILEVEHFEIKFYLTNNTIIKQ